LQKGQRSCSVHFLQGGSAPIPCRGIAAVHAGSESTAATDWDEIVGLYEVLMRASPSPVVELNRGVAVAVRDGPGAGVAQHKHTLICPC
jgi:predicted RNA polymerase sigma factor